MARRVTVIRLIVGIMIWLILLYLAVVTWKEFVEVTGDTLDECDRGTCGALGEFTSDHPAILFLLFLVGTAIPAGAIAWFVGHLFRVSNRPRRDAGDQPVDI